MIRTLRIRMYNAGFGDCFLLSFGVENDQRHVLVDCGSITETQERLAAIVADIVETCTPADGGSPRLELVVASQRQRDHVSGFADPAWKGVEVGEVWMPWTEDPEDLVAERLVERQSALALALAQGLAPDLAGAEESPVGDLADPGPNAAPAAMALNALTNAAALRTLHRGFAGAPVRRYLPSPNAAREVRTLERLPGLRAHVLGPERSEAAAASLEPPRGAAGLRAALAEATSGGERRGAFDLDWRVDRATYQRKPTTFSAADQRTVDRQADEDSGLTAALSWAVNNTSLILMFEVGEQWLLFPGDAQTAAWDAVLHEPRWRQFLTRTTVYKAGHHGGANGTPRALIETVAQPPVVFVPTRPLRFWPNIPHEPLLQALERRGATLIRPDAPHMGAATDPRLYFEWGVDLTA